MDNNYCDISIVLDRSGSMSLCKDDIINGFNEFIENQKKEQGKVKVTLCQFNNEYEILYDGIDISNLPKLTKDNYIPKSSTALMDALGRTILSTGSRLAKMPEMNRPGKVLFLIITDGLENASIGYTREQVKDMVLHQKDKYSWTFVYIGADQDTAMESCAVGTGNYMCFDLTNNGIKKMYGDISHSVSDYRKVGKWIQ